MVFVGISQGVHGICRHITECSWYLQAYHRVLMVFVGISQGVHGICRHITGCSWYLQAYHRVLKVFADITKGGRALSLPRFLEVKIYDETKEIKNEGGCGKQSSAF